MQSRNQVVALGFFKIRLSHWVFLRSPDGNISNSVMKCPKCGKDNSLRTHPQKALLLSMITCFDPMELFSEVWANDY